MVSKCRNIIFATEPCLSVVVMFTIVGTAAAEDTGHSVFGIGSTQTLDPGTSLVKNLVLAEPYNLYVIEIRGPIGSIDTDGAIQMDATQFSTFDGNSGQ